MGRQKLGIYEKYLEFDSIKQYLRQSIGAKKSRINSNSTFEELVASADISQYLRGLRIFLDEYFEHASNPYELIKFMDNLGNNKKAISEFVLTIDNFVSWLKSKGYSDKTVLKYQAHVRAFIHKNHFNYSFKNFDADSERQIDNEKLGVDVSVIKEILWKIPSYTNDYYLKMLIEGMQKTGLGSDEIRSLTFGDLRYRFRTNSNGDEQKFVKIEKRREKSNRRFLTWFYGEYKRKVIKHLEMHPKSEYPDDQSWLVKSYHAFQQSFTNAYKNCIKKEYPEFLIIENGKLKKIATLHWYRHIFCSSAEIVGVPSSLIDLFVGHKGDAIRNIYHEIPDKKKLEFFKKVQEELFGVRESETREIIEREIIERLTVNLLNTGKRQTIFDRIEHNHEDLKNEPNDVKMGYFLTKIIDIAKNELRTDESFKAEISLEIEEKIVKKYNLTPKS